MHKLDVGPIYRKLMEEDPLRKKFGWIPLLAHSSLGQIGSLSAESFCERMMSVGKFIMPIHSTRLGSDEVDKVMVLRMNREKIKMLKIEMRDHIQEQVSKMRENLVASCEAEAQEDFFDHTGTEDAFFAEIEIEEEF